MTIIREGFKSEYCREGTEKKANYFIPQAVHRFHHSRQNMFYKLPAMAHRLAGISLPHDFIVTKPLPRRLYQYRTASKLPIEIVV